MPDKPQQQTLSVRISEALRRRLERARQLAASTSGESVSTSEIAKQLLESAREDRLDVVNLLAEPTAALLQIRRKGEAQHPLSVAEWTVLAYFAQQGLEAFSVDTPSRVSRESLIGVLDAFLAVYDLRDDRTAEGDDYYLGKLPAECRPAVKRGARSDQVTPDIVRRTVVETRRRVSDPTTAMMPLFVGRNLYHVLDASTTVGTDAVNRALRPFWPVLWRLAARGHYAVIHAPVREPATRQAGLYQPPIPSITEGTYTLSFARAEGQDFSVLLSFPGVRGPLYPISGYPKLTEFRAMLAMLASTPEHRSWAGAHFFGYTTQDAKRVAAMWFRAQDNGITFGFSTDEWASIQTLFRRAWELPAIRMAWDALTFEYGEL
jgi:hypothetical protein